MKKSRTTCFKLARLELTYLICLTVIRARTSYRGNTLASIVQYLPTWAETAFRTRVTVGSRRFEVATSLLTTAFPVFLPCTHTLVLCKVKMAIFLTQSLEFFKSVVNRGCLMAIKRRSHLWKMQVGWNSLIDLTFSLGFTPFWSDLPF